MKRILSMILILIMIINSMPLSSVWALDLDDLSEDSKSDVGPSDVDENEFSSVNQTEISQTIESDYEVTEDLPPTTESDFNDSLEGGQQSENNSIEELETDANDQIQAKVDENASQKVEEEDVVYFGTFGTSYFTIDSDNVLHIYGGEFASNEESRSPWYNWRNYIDKIIFEEEVKANENSSYLFNGLLNLTSISNLEKLDTSAVTDMGWMFASTSKLVSGSEGMSNWNTSNVTSMNAMFFNSGFTSLEIGNWDTGNVTNMNKIFSSSKATSINLQYWDLSKVTDLTEGFQGVVANLYLNRLDTGEVTSMRALFQNSTITFMPGADITSINTSNVTDMSYMYYNATLTTTGHVLFEYYDTSNVTDMTYMFANYKGLVPNVLGFNTSNVTSMRAMFYGYSGSSLNVSGFDTSNVTDMSLMFDSAINLVALDLSNWDVSNVVNMAQIFRNTSKMTRLDVSTWKTSSLENGTYVFSNMTSLTSLDLSNWVLNSSTDISRMFSGSTKIQALTLGKDILFTQGLGGLASISETDIYTGKWQNVGGGTVDAPSGEHILSSTELLSSFDGSSMADTYVWQPKPNYESIVAEDSFLDIGDDWNPEDNFVSATDKFGENVSFDMVSVAGQVDTSKAGKYPITYTYASSSTTITVTVIGYLSIHVPETLNFGSYQLGSEDSSLPYEGENIVVVDDRENSSGWTLSVTIEESSSGFSNFIMNGSSKLSDSNIIAKSESSGTKVINQSWTNKEGLFIDYSSVSSLRDDYAILIWTLSPNTDDMEE
ncbi:BspA family leucine-rich repeat surface protein [Enterococcus sp. AZ012]|uniref:BspA family leucine-rich repeat surface protein n=1 Tax=unclassified Enterococcus TaxID=2608891 RepID=UPI003D2991FB